ncbi:MAG: RdgB/HAM1 family non-canonical purine NTP pyrophosphatase [Oscillospiraceae bacterium]|nr:RdgB/HAM1 family non-canonical purine NTP pyrophosphatase [Oscillospiraceae bacterium]MBQ8788754.1 RdgB/HAM1 family non-canonical purine NTP pyrophosphatase [Oscillospiraceae bacterium]
MKLIIASNNAHKLVEMKAILGQYFEEILSLREAGIDHETIEDGETFLENAEKKAREIAEISGCCAIADDSGICADALGGAPGIYSARFCGHHGDDEANNRLLLEKLKNEENKKAHYTCAIVLVYPDGKKISAEGYLYGEITENRAGKNGFGYDPYFYLPEYGCTTAELDPEVKNKISHRANAIRELVKKLKNQ